MFPGSGRHSYNNQPQGYGGYGQYPPQQYPPQQYQQYPPQQYQQYPPQQYPPQQLRGYSSPSQIQAPPSGPQRFSSQMNASYQYSNCTGRRKALLIGINYFGSSNELKGCVNDVKNMSRFLIERFGYTYNDMVILSDDQSQYNKMPTTQNIIRSMQWLVAGAQPNDSLVFHYSGHGGLTKDLDGDEDDGYDEVIYPLDFKQNGFIVDDTMHDLMVKPLPPGCRLTALFDSCHSGTALDLPYMYSTKGVVKEPNLVKDVGGDALGAFLQYERGNLGGALLAIGGIAKKVYKLSQVDNDKVKQMKASPADVISISGSKDDQTSADARINGVATGAMSYSFITALTRNPNQSFLSLLNDMRDILDDNYSQKPQLSTSHPTDMNLRFIM